MPRTNTAQDAATPDTSVLRSASLVVWHAAAAVLILTVPVRMQFGEPFRVLPNQQAQAWVWTVAYLLFAIALSGMRFRWSIAWLLRAAVTGAVIAAAAYATLRFVLEAQASRTVALIAVAMTGALVMLGMMLGRWLPAGALVVAMAASVMSVRELKPLPEARERTVATAFHSFSLREYRDLFRATDMPGGAIAARGDGFILVNGAGEFSQLDWSGPGGELVARRLPLTAKFNLDSMMADSASREAELGHFVPVRTNDIAIDTTVSPHRVYLAHNYWNTEGRCQTIRVSAADLPEPGAEENSSAWSTIYETAPCLQPTYEMRAGGVGSRLAWTAPGVLLLSVADHGVSVDTDDGVTDAQDTAHPYGKILRLDSTGHAEIFSVGHRNPQGLTVGPDGSVWSTEHGPQGGDEVNHIEKGANYGYPLASYGNQYGQDNWPLAAGRRDHAQFYEPALAFVPSVGVSNLIVVGEASFPKWNGDLLVSTLREKSLFRLRTRGNRVVYSERIPVGRRVRDLEQVKDGRIILWTDDNYVVVLSPGPAQSMAEAAYAACATCHGAQLEGTAAGPSLRGVVNREVASQPGFAYSDALKRFGGRWTTERLQQYLLNPSAMVPGTSMAFPGITNTSRFWVVEYLRNYRASETR